MKISLRQKIFLMFFILMVINGLIWFASYSVDSVLKQKLQIIDKKNNLFNTILEARRYEKNFFLNHNRDHLVQALAYVGDAEEKFARIIEEHVGYTLTQNFDEKMNDIRAYRAALESMLPDVQRGDPDTAAARERMAAAQEQVSELGRKLTNDIEKIVQEERKHVQRLLTRSQIGFFGSIAALLVICVVTVLFLVVNVNGPLMSIEKAIDKIVAGDGTTIPAVTSGDEFESLVDRLNNMITELNRRTESLVQIEKLASLGTLTSGVAHELNNPLNNISTSLQILLEELETPDRDYQREMLTEAERQVERARDTVKALLEFSRQTSFNKKPVNLKGLVEKTIRLIKSELPDGIAVRVDVPATIEASLDAQRIQQVLINFIINAVHAMPEGGTLDIRGFTEPEKERFILQIRDSGIGIPEENIARIFDPFFTTKEVGKGSGLGLSIIHGIIEQHGGHISVESTPGAGTTFTLQLPMNA